MYGVGFGVFAGWVPGLGIFAFRGHRENVRRVKAVVIERYEAYWQERCEAQRALQHGADPAHVAARLGSHHLAQFAA